MKIGIDTLGLEHGQSGLGSYLFYLMENLSQNDSIEYELFGQEADRYTYKAKFDVKYSAVNVSDSVNSQQRWHRWHLNKFVRSQKYDAVIYCAAPRMLPRKSSAKGIAIVNDLVSVFLENKKDKSYSSSGIKNLKKIDKIIVPNEYVKSDLTNLDIDAGKIVIIPNGIDHGIFYQYNLSDSEFVDIKPFAIKRPYIIYPTRISDAEKNHIKLIEAFNIFKNKTKLPHRLVLAGSQDDYAEKVQNAILESPFASDIFLTGFFPHKELGLLYSNADSCVFPSSHEGVGLPVLECMACGIPVACADKGALPEISGKNAVLFDPSDADQIAAALEEVVTNQCLRQKLVQNGLEWSSLFTWKNTAVKIGQLLLSL